MYATTSCSLPFGHKQEVKLYLEKSGFDSFQPRAVLFDMDGVLYDSMPNHARCWQAAMAKFGLKMTAADVYATEGMRGVADGEGTTRARHLRRRGANDV